jgi:hypothetical protein
MPYWAIYTTDGVGLLRQVVDTAPSLEMLAAQGLGCAYFGEDPPDLGALEWCPRKLSFVAKRVDESADVAMLKERVRMAEEQLFHLMQPREGWLSRMKARFSRGGG